MINISGSSRASGLGLLWAFLISLAWLLPNHFPPWASFHADAWFSIVLACAAILLFTSGKETTFVSAVVPFIGLISIVPWVQYAIGVLPFAGQAWISFLYVFGFALAAQMGVRWSELGEFELPDALFFAILIASTGSAGLALGMWLGVVNSGMDSVISMGHVGSRQYANLGQPNLLATLLLWGNVAGLWFYVRKKIGGITVFFTVTYLSLCISLTGSRQAYVGTLLSILFLYVYKSLWGSGRVFWGAIACLVLMVLGTELLTQVYSFLFFENMANPLVRPSNVDSPRLQAWMLFLRASAEHPWLGFGLTEVVGAQLSVVQHFPAMGVLFGHTHNVLLDLVVWLGYPLAILITSMSAVWFYFVLKRMQVREDAVLLLVILIFIVHAMLELPHQYAIFLFPVGLVVGVLSYRLNIFPVIMVDRRVFLGFSVVISLVLSVVVYDYFKIEDSYNRFRFERRGFKYVGDEIDKTPNTFILTQFENWFTSVVYKDDPVGGLQNISVQEQAVGVFPSSGAMFELALSFARNGQPQEAKKWFDKICKVSSPEECSFLKKIWKDKQVGNPNFSLINWE